MRFSPGIPRGALPGGLGVLFEGLERFAGRLGARVKAGGIII
jgi:hypothetical protein